ncbi:MAG: hypothetical protein ABI970_23585, partial [Chloroflexota bacterium]
GRSQTSSIVLRDIDRDLDGRLTDRYGINAVAKWSPDGQQIAYLTLNDTLFHVYVMDALGKNKRQLPLEFTTLDSGYVWSPDSQYILFSVSVKGIPQSLILKVASGQLYPLPQAIGLGIWSPDSQSIIYQASTENGTSHAYAMNIHWLADALTRTFQELDMFHDQPTYDQLAWSPDGQAIAFTQEDQVGNTKIVVASLRCGNLTDRCIDKYTVAAKGILLRAPIWSPDNQYIAFVSNTITVATVNLTTGERRTFYTPDILPNLKDWSPDGRYIAYLSSQSGIFNVNLLDTFSGQVRPLFTNQISTEFPEWRPIPR